MWWVLNASASSCPALVVGYARSQLVKQLCVNSRLGQEDSCTASLTTRDAKVNIPILKLEKNRKKDDVQLVVSSRLATGSRC